MKSLLRHVPRTLMLAGGVTLAVTQATAQMKIGENPSEVIKSAILELSSNKQGLLLPRIPDFSAINTAIGTDAADGMIVYLASATPAQNGLYVRKAGTWVKMPEGGSISSISLTMPVPFSVSPATLTTNGTFNVGMLTQPANTIFATPNGTAGTASFRTLVAADLPSLPFSKITGVVPISQGGTGLTAVGAAGTVLTSNGTSLSYAATPSASLTLTGDVTGTSAAGTMSTTIANQAVTYSKIQNINSQKLLGRFATGAGSLQEVSLDNTLKLTTAGALYADSALGVWNASKVQGMKISAKTPANGEVLKWNGTAWETNTDNDGGATYATLANNDISNADVAGSTTRMKIWASPLTGNVVNGVSGTSASSWNVLSFRGVGYTTQLYFDKNTLAVKEWGGTTAPLTTNAGNIWYKAILTNGNTNIQTGAILFGNVTSDASSEVTQDNANLFFDDTNNRLGVGTNTPNATLTVNGGVSIMAIKTVSSNNNGTLTYTALENDYTIIGKLNANGNLNVSLPTASNHKGKMYIVKRASGGNGTLTVSAAGGGFDETAGNPTIATGKSHIFQSDGNTWWIIGSF
ncbi:hypothetical protein ACDQ55_17150 [Chitinophaga sp. 30R24]|uniref:hypothetical protein n=1 Tax=Chitinophaga sp. 30R24 TaxID=3248838 RepID=UPI003B9027BB